VELGDRTERTEEERREAGGVPSVATGLAPVERNGPKSAGARFVWRLAPKPVAFDGRKVHRDAHRLKLNSYKLKTPRRPTASGCFAMTFMRSHA
jgi:hypothetical protein